MALASLLASIYHLDCNSVSVTLLTTVYPKAAKRSIPCAPLLSLNASTVMIAAAELLAYNYKKKEVTK